MPKTALIAGATGLVGSYLLKLLQEDPDYNEIIVLVRKPISSANEKVIQHVMDFKDLSRHEEKLKADDYFCCLGTTMKKAGSKQAFYEVDFTYVYSLAQIASANNARSFNFISAMGANKKSIIFYNKVKGKAEEAVSSLKFKLVNIIRPSLILGNRKEKRSAERLAQTISTTFSFLFTGLLKGYKPIEAETIAVAMMKSVKRPSSGIHIIESYELAQLANGH